jgi:hypothetical protein
VSVLSFITSTGSLRHTAPLNPAECLAQVSSLVVVHRTVSSRIHTALSSAPPQRGPLRCHRRVSRFVGWMLRCGPLTHSSEAFANRSLESQFAQSRQLLTHLSRLRFIVTNCSELGPEPSTSHRDRARRTHQPRRRVLNRYRFAPAQRFASTACPTAGANFHARVGGSPLA